MTLTDTDRQSLINYRIKQAFETIELAEFLLKEGKLILAVNRIYYGMYYALTAFALEQQFETSKHQQLIGWFNKSFVSSGEIDSRYGKILRNAFQNRTKGDYDAYISFEKEEVSSMLNEMKDFIEMIKNRMNK
jgi:uncharacterized protein (UPF0332 family)